MLAPLQVVEDSDHAAVVETLQSLRESEPSLLVAVLDALGNLSLPPSLLEDITVDALGLLESAEAATLPVLVRGSQIFFLYVCDFFIGCFLVGWLGSLVG